MSLTRLVFNLSLLALAIAFTNSCSDGVKSEEKQSIPEESERYGGVFATNQFQEFTTLIPLQSFENSARKVGSHVLETLMMYAGDDHSLAPCLASKWEANENSTCFYFTIREDIFFHDDDCFEEGKGRLLEPEDVLYCLRRLCSNVPENKNAWLFTGQVLGAQEYYKSYKENKDADIKGIRMTDDDRIAIELIRPNPEFLHVLAHYGTSIYPQEMVQNHDDDMGIHIVGTGPFQTKIMHPGEVVIFERNQNYWGLSASGDPLPYLDGVKISFEKKAMPVRNALNSGALDAVIDGDVQEGGEIFNEIVAKEKTKFHGEGLLDYEIIYCGFLNSQGTFKNELVRKAFNLAVDKKMIAEVTLKGSGYPGIHGIVPPAFSSFPINDVPGYALDVPKAEALLAQAGYPDGEGFPLITLQIQNRYKDVIVAQVIQEQLLKNLNVTIAISALPRAEHFRRIENREAEFWLDNWAADFLDPQNFLSLFLSNNTPEASGSLMNTYRYVDSNFDSLIEQAMGMTDEKNRMQIYAKADSTMMSAAAILPVYYEKTQFITKTELYDLPPPLMGRLDLRSARMHE